MNGGGSRKAFGYASKSDMGAGSGIDIAGPSGAPSLRVRSSAKKRQTLLSENRLTVNFFYFLKLGFALLIKEFDGALWVQRK